MNQVTITSLPTGQTTIAWADLDGEPRSWVLPIGTTVDAIDAIARSLVRPEA